METKEIEELLKDRERLNFIEQYCCTVHKDINEIRMNIHIWNKHTDLRSAIDSSLALYKKEGWIDDEHSN